MRILKNILTIIVLLIVVSLLVDRIIFSPRIAYISTSKLLIGFSDAARVEKELKTEDDKWQGQFKQLQDSLQASMDLMSKEYDRASAARKKELQDMLSARNQQVNNFRQANIRKMEELRQKKMQNVFDKVNVYVTEYGRKHRYSIIFGTAVGGNILYGNESRYDITEKIIKGLNERYK